VRTKHKVLSPAPQREAALERKELLGRMSFGARVAEEETAALSRYFVETGQWARLFSGEVDVIKGEKGAGKSAIYSLLISKSSELFDRRILLVAAEKPQGTPAFRELTADPPASESEFVGLWKLYIIALVAETANEYGIHNAYINDLRGKLADQGLIDEFLDLPRLLKKALTYVRGWIAPRQLETGIAVDPATMVPSFSFKITPSEPGEDDRARGAISIDRLAQLAERGLETANYEIWVLLDRLDVAFAESQELEKNALRALFRVYRDFGGLSHIRIKIFIRSDIWKKISEEGFREASHITKDIEIDWSKDDLLNLIMRRVVDNEVLGNEYRIDKEYVLQNYKMQSALFYKLFPDQVDQGSKKPPTLDWILSRCADGTGKTAPREVIHLLNTIRDQEIRRLGQGKPLPPDGALFDRSVFKTSLLPVSEARLVQTIYAEYPSTKPIIVRLTGEKTEQTIDSVASIWGVNSVEAQTRIEELVNIGFFQRRGSREQPTFWVPFLYRDALNMIQGKAGEANRPDDEADD